MIEIANINIEFERFLNNEKDNFCKFRCQYSGGKQIEVEDYGGDIIKVDPCDYCNLNEFIREIRDSKIKVLE